tara:strand:- start:87 stop:551 length:465 start_codon:yes stop_codon:yes gene_type:complete
MGLEQSGINDTIFSAPIRISTTVRKKYKSMFPEDHEYQKMPNAKLNKVIAEQFALSGNNQKEDMPIYFHNKNQPDYKSSLPYESREKPLSELRMAVWNRGERLVGSTSFFVSFLRDGYIDVLTIQQGYLPRKKRGPKYMKYRKDWAEKRRLGRY